ncbi:MAG: hypothetical protein J5651_09740 [Salinivirgaceae bacterium]|nr:hypothetical protein [Salinivirgaceae bacterium]
MEKQFKDALNDSVISKTREKLSKHRPDLLDGYDDIILKLEKNKCSQNLINEMRKLLGAIIGDISATYGVSEINQTANYTQPDDSEVFTIHKEVITLLNHINKCIHEKMS